MIRLLLILLLLAGCASSGMSNGECLDYSLMKQQELQQQGIQSDILPCFTQDMYGHAVVREKPGNIIHDINKPYILTFDEARKKYIFWKDENGKLKIYGE